MNKFVIYISLALTFMLSVAGAADAQIATSMRSLDDFTIDTDIHSLRNAAVPAFHYSFDDYTQFAPAALVLGLKSCGYESRTKWGGMIVSDAFSLGILSAATYGLKYTVKRMRPDCSERTSFPSGHSGRAFAAAAVLDKEYGWRSPWFSIGGYTVAAVTGVSRILNDRHWMSDVVAGAALGVGSVHLGYYLADLIFKGKHLYDGYEKPVFEYDPGQKHYVAELLFARRFILGSESQKNAGVLPFRGSLAGLQTDIPVIPGAGVTGRFTASSMTYKDEHTSVLYSATAGGYWNLPFARRFEFQTRAGAGYAGMSGESGLDITAGAGLSFMLDSNFKIKALAEYDSIGLLPSTPWIHSFLIGYSVPWFW